eukprot:RCo053446
MPPRLATAADAQWCWQFLNAKGSMRRPEARGDARVKRESGKPTLTPLKAVDRSLPTQAPAKPTPLSPASPQRAPTVPRPFSAPAVPRNRRLPVASGSPALAPQPSYAPVAAIPRTLSPAAIPVMTKAPALAGLEEVHMAKGPSKHVVSLVSSPTEASNLTQLLQSLEMLIRGSTPNATEEIAALPVLSSFDAERLRFGFLGITQYQNGNWNQEASQFGSGLGGGFASQASVAPSAMMSHIAKAGSFSGMVDGVLAMFKPWTALSEADKLRRLFTLDDPSFFKLRKIWIVLDGTPQLVTDENCHLFFTNFYSSVPVMDRMARIQEVISRVCPTVTDSSLFEELSELDLGTYPPAPLASAEFLRMVHHRLQTEAEVAYWRGRAESAAYQALQGSYEPLPHPTLPRAGLPLDTFLPFAERFLHGDDDRELFSLHLRNALHDQAIREAQHRALPVPLPTESGTHREEPEPLPQAVAAPGQAVDFCSFVTLLHVLEDMERHSKRKALELYVRQLWGLLGGSPDFQVALRVDLVRAHADRVGIPTHAL